MDQINTTIRCDETSDFVEKLLALGLVVHLNGFHLGPDIS